MSRKKIILRLIAIVALLLIASVVIIYIQASRTPDDYHPMKLSKDELAKTAGKFVQHVVLDFSNNAQRIKPFEWQISEEQINRYLASIDEIAFLRAGRKRGEVNSAMRSVGMAGPMIKLADGTVTFMITLTDLNKVASIELGAELTEDKSLKLGITCARIGKMRVPKGVLVGPLRKLRGKLENKQTANSDMNNADKIANVLAILLAAMDDKPIKPEKIWRIKRIRIALDSLAISENGVKIKVRPIGPTRDEESRD